MLWKILNNYWSKWLFNFVILRHDVYVIHLLKGPCLNHACKNGATCMEYDTGEDYICVCRRENTGRYCENSKDVSTPSPGKLRSHTDDSCCIDYFLFLLLLLLPFSFHFRFVLFLFLHHLLFLIYHLLLCLFLICFLLFRRFGTKFLHNFPTPGDV